MMYFTEPDSCDPGRSRTREDHSPYTPPICDECGSDAIFPISLAGLGLFCSAGCTDAAVEKHAAALSRPKEIAS